MIKKRRVSRSLPKALRPAAKKLKEAASEGSNITEDLDALRNKPPLARIAVFVAGVTCNYITAIVFMGILLWYGRAQNGCSIERDRGDTGGNQVVRSGVAFRGQDSFG